MDKRKAATPAHRRPRARPARGPSAARPTLFQRDERLYCCASATDARAGAPPGLPGCDCAVLTMQPPLPCPRRWAAAAPAWGPTPTRAPPAGTTPFGATHPAECSPFWEPQLAGRGSLELMPPPRPPGATDAACGCWVCHTRANAAALGGERPCARQCALPPSLAGPRAFCCFVPAPPLQPWRGLTPAPVLHDFQVPQFAPRCPAVAPLGHRGPAVRVRRCE